MFWKHNNEFSLKELNQKIVVKIVLNIVILFHTCRRILFLPINGSNLFKCKSKDLNIKASI